MINIEMSCIYNENIDISRELDLDISDHKLILLLDDAIKKILAEELMVSKEIFESIFFEISLSIVNEEEIKEINKSFRNIDKITDVLSFPQYENLKDISNEFESQRELFLGDVVICLNKVKEQAVEFGHSTLREFIYLYVHSILHLLGYDHINEDDKKTMRNKEEYYMEKLSLKRK